MLTDFDEIWHRRLEPETKVAGVKIQKGISYFYPILLQIGTNTTHFQWVSDICVICGQIIVVHSSNDVTRWPPTLNVKRAKGTLLVM